MKYEEPWKMFQDGVGKSEPTGYVVGHREIIKNRADAPHIAICMPVGPKTDEVRDGDGNVIKTYRHPGLVPIELMLNQMQVTQPLGVSLTWIMMKNDLSGRLREKMTDTAIEQGANFIFYWDDDVLIPANTLYRMLSWMARYPDIGAISGVYFTKISPSEPVLYKDAGVGAYWGFNLDPDASPEDVYAAGAGCLMARVNALKCMERPWWDDERTGTPDGSRQGVIGHDIRFCRKMREETGYRVTVDGSIQCSHLDIANEKLFFLPEDRPPMEEARAAADLHSRLTPEDIEEATRDSSEEEIRNELEI